MYFDGPYGVYHSQYDDYFRQSTVVDPGFRYGVALSQLWSIMAWRLADADVLPMRYSDYARAAVGYIEAAEAHAGSDKPLRLDAARAAARRWEDAATQFETRLDKATLTPLPRVPSTSDCCRSSARWWSHRACVAGRSSVTCWWHRNPATAAPTCRGSGTRSIATIAAPSRRTKRRSLQRSIAPPGSCAKRPACSAHSARLRRLRCGPGDETEPHDANAGTDDERSEPASAADRLVQYPRGDRGTEHHRGLPQRRDVGQRGDRLRP